MSAYERNLDQMLKLSIIVILIHIPIFSYMAHYFETEQIIAIGGPLLIGIGQVIFSKIFSNKKIGATLMGFSAIALSAIMIHLGKGMIEWHFHIFVFIGILSLLATPSTIIAAALTAAVHHVGFYFILPKSIFNYEASLGIVAIHAGFVVVEAIACTFLSYRFQKVLILQEQINSEIGPLVQSIDNASNLSSDSCVSLLNHTNNNSSAITEISSTAEQIAQMVASTKNQLSKVLENMGQTMRSVNDSSQAISKGKDFIQSLNAIKDNMKELQQSSSKQLNDVVDSVNNISDKTNIINDIVFQTKLLSFNASVEAARAGEHGKGFAVVAEEIGALATTSGNASQEISQIVNTSKEQLNSSVESVGNSLSQFQESLNQAYSFWNDINENLKGSFEQVEYNSQEQEMFLKEISQAADQQSQGVKELSDALSSIDESSYKSLDQIKKVEGITTQLKDDAQKLNSLHKKMV